MIRNRREASRPIFATDIWHRFLLCCGTARGGSVEEMLNINDEYVEVWCVSSATHMPYVFRGQVKVLESECLLPYVVAQIVQYRWRYC